MSVQSVDIINAFKKSQFTFFNIKEAQIELLPMSGRVRCNISVLSFALNFYTDSLFKIYHHLFFRFGSFSSISPCDSAGS